MLAFCLTLFHWMLFLVCGFWNFTIEITSWFSPALFFLLKEQEKDVFSDVSRASITQQQDERSRPKTVFMTAAAQPTSACTVMASVGQLRAQAPHSMHASRFSIWAFPLFMPRTACGQTRRHIPQATHFSGSSSSVTTSFR